MRAEQNWEDEIGRRLREHAEEPPPMAWERIDRQLRPQRRRWLWLLALVPLLLSLPFAWTEMQELSEQKQTALNRQEPARSQQPEAAGAASHTSRAAATSATEKDLQQEAEQHQPSAAASSVADATESEAAPRSESASPRPAAAGGSGIIAAAGAGKPVKPLLKPEEKTAQEAEEPRKPKTRKSAPKPAVTSRTVSEPILAKQAEKPVQIAAAEAAAENRKTADPAGKAKAAQEAETLTLSGKQQRPGAEPAVTTAATTEGTSETATVAASDITAATETARTETPLASPADTAATAVAAAEEQQSEEQTLEPEKAAAEEPEEDEKQKGKWQLVLHATPQYMAQLVQPNTEDDIYILRLNNKNEVQAERLSYNLSLRVRRNLTERLSLEAGASFAYFQQFLNVTYNYGLADSLVLQQAGGQLTGQAFQRQAQQEYRYIFYLGGAYTGLVLDLQRALRLPLSISAGGGMNWIVSDEQRPDDSPSAIKRSAKPYLSASICYSRPLSPNVALQAGPSVQYYLSSFQEKEAIIAARPVLWGLQLGLVFGGQR